MTPPPKIGLLIDQLLPGGVQISAIEYTRELIRLGYPAQLLILMRKKYPTDFSYLVQGIPSQFISDSYPGLFRHTVKLPIFTFLSTLHLLSPLLAPKILKNQGFGHIISFGTTTCLTAHSLYKSLNISYTAIIHDPIIYILDKVYSTTPLRHFFFILKPIAHYFESLFVKNASTTIVISPLHGQYLHTNYHITPHLLGFGCHPQKRLPSKRGPWLLSFGRWQKAKNPLLLLQIIKSLPQTKIIIAGTWTSSDDLAWLKSQISALGLQARVQLFTTYSTSQLTRLCNRSLLWLHPHFEAYGLAALEAAAHGLPIIIPAGSGVTAGFTHGHDGFFPKSATLNQYLPYIKKLLAHPALAQKLGSNAWQTTRAKHSWAAHTQQLLSLISPSFLPHIYVIETGHATGTTLAGGDKLMEPMFDRLHSSYHFHIVVSQLGSPHWLSNPHPKQIHILPATTLDKSGQPQAVFLTYCWRMLHCSWHLIRQPNIDLLYSSTNVLPDLLPAFVAKLFHPSSKWIARIHHLIPPPRLRPGKYHVNLVSYLMQLLGLWLVKYRADTIIALNSPLADDLTSMGFPPQKIHVLGGGIDQAKIAAHHPPPATRNYQGIFIGRLHSSKGVSDLVPIWQEVSKKLPGSRLAVIGPGLEYLHPLPRFPHIAFLGQVSESRKLDLLKKSRVFLFTDHEAGWGIAVAEAMAAGVPVVGYDIGILGSVYQAGYLLVPPFDTHRFAQQIIKLLARPKLLSHYSRQAYRQSLSLDWSITSQKFKMILDVTLGQSHD